MRQSLAGSRHLIDTMPGVKHVEAWTTGMVCKNQTSTRLSSRTCLASEAGQAVNLHGFRALPAGASPGTAMKALSSLLPLLLQDTHRQPEFHSRPASCQLTRLICTPPQACGIQQGGMPARSCTTLPAEWSRLSRLSRSNPKP